ncbi:MAG: cellulase family glycosylhydrolase [Spirochaetes bacterium]|nr:cellulase family glycosylhydrolase [Spirochaetota bacterium]
MRQPALFLILALLVPTLPPAAERPEKKWFGFNLTEQYTLGKQTNFRESDFAWMRKHGFTFARLPLDYRIYVDAGDETRFNEKALAAIDEAVALGKKYGVHVCINLHKAPGYCINPVKGLDDQLWTNAATEDRFVAYWEMFARRYKKESPAAVSLNLLNEPARTAASNYLRVFGRATDAIHRIDPDRLVVVDGMDVGKTPFPELYKRPNTILSTRGYVPGNVSHYKAEWNKGADKLPVPIWPLVPAMREHFYSPTKGDVPHSALVLQGKFPAGTRGALRIAQVSDRADLVVEADGRTLLEKSFVPSSNQGEWKEIVYKKEYSRFQNVYDLDVPFRLDRNAQELSLRVTNGDWMRASGLTLVFPDGRSNAIPALYKWGAPQPRLNLDTSGQLTSTEDFDPNGPVNEFLAPWRAAIQDGARAFVGEMGAYKYTPHEVTLRWLEYCLKQYQAMGIGWAFWNLRGPFGPLDSGRKDVAYEKEGDLLVDRAMLDLMKATRVR